jgi:hypothetical protein
MSNSSQTPSEAGDGVRISATQARGGVQRGVYKILIVSTLLSVMAAAVAWLLLLPR